MKLFIFVVVIMFILLVSGYNVSFRPSLVAVCMAANAATWSASDFACYGCGQLPAINWLSYPVEPNCGKSDSACTGAEAA